MAVDYEQQALELLRKLACWFGAGDNHSFQSQEHDVQLIAAALYAAFEGRAENERLKARLAEAEKEREKIYASRKQFLEDCTDDMECLSNCDSYGHEDDCPVTNPAAAFRKLRQQLQVAREALEKLHGFALAIMESWPDGDVDGFDLQEIAEKHGLIESFFATESCGENCLCVEEGKWPQNCYRRASLLAADALARLK